MFRCFEAPASKGGKFLKEFSLSRAVRNFPGANILIVGSLEKKEKSEHARIRFETFLIID